MRINDAISHLTSVFIQWQGLLKDPNYVRTGNIVCWTAHNIAVLPANLTRSYSRNLSHARQFTFRVSEDNSLIQLAYEFSQAGYLTRARLAYLEVGDVLDVEDGVVPVPESSGEDAIKWMRIDYDSTALVTALHAACHMHFSGHDGVRVALKGVPSPAQFVELVMAYYYPASYSLLRLNEQGRPNDVNELAAVNASLIELTDAPDDLLSIVPHLRIPGF